MGAVFRRNKETNQFFGFMLRPDMTEQPIGPYDPEDFERAGLGDRNVVTNFQGDPWMTESDAVRLMEARADNRRSLTLASLPALVKRRAEDRAITAKTTLTFSNDNQERDQAHVALEKAEADGSST